MQISFVLTALVCASMGFLSYADAATLGTTRGMARPSVRQIAATTSTNSAARAATARATLPSAARAATSTTGTNSRLSIGRLHTNAGRTISSTPGTSGGSDVDLSEYATLTQLGAVEADIVDIELEIGGMAAEIDNKANADDVYTRSEVDDIISALELDGVAGADGLSAYEVAVANGFIGSEAAWLASLKGEPGDGGNIDLSDYATIDALATKADAATTYSKDEVDALIDGVEVGTVDLSAYSTTEQVNAALVTKADAATTYTKEEIDAFIAGLESAIGDISIPDLTAYATTAAMNAALAGKENKIVGGADAGKALVGTSMGWTWGSGGTTDPGGGDNPGGSTTGSDGSTCTPACPANWDCFEGQCYDPNAFEW